MKVLFVDVKKEEMTLVSEKGYELFEGSLDKVSDSKLKSIEVLSIFIYSQVSKDQLDKMPKLKLIITRSTGFDHIDIVECKKRGIQVGNVPYYGENTVAEHSFALILSLSRNVHKSHIRTIQGNYEISGLQGFDLKGKTLGVIGVGHIGLHVIRIAKGFGMHVKAFDARKDTFISEILHYDYSGLDDLLKTSDIITLHMPLNDSTVHFLDEKKLRKTKPGVIIINTSRGGLIDTDALYRLLKSGHIGGAGLDVIEGEEYIKEDLALKKSDVDKLRKIFMDKEIFKMDNVIFTPHNAFNSREAITRIYESTLENLVSFKGAGKPKYPVWI